PRPLRRLSVTRPRGTRRLTSLSARRRADLAQHGAGVALDSEVAERYDAERVLLIIHHDDAPDVLLAHQLHRVVDVVVGGQRRQIARTDLRYGRALRVEPLSHGSHRDVAVGDDADGFVVLFYDHGADVGGAHVAR